jgi:hypothetical protein
MGHTTKPIYVGEFNLSNTNESSRFLRWSYLLGYQGTWWWSLNSRCPDRYPCRESVDIPLIQFNAVKDTKRLVGDLSANRNARAAFQIRRELSSDGLRAVDQADWSFWLSEGQVILAALNDLTGSSSSEQGLRNELLQRRNDIKKLSSELEKDTPSCVTINDAEVAKKKLDVDRLKEEIRKQKQILIDRPDGDLDEALRAQTKHYIADYEDQLERAGLRLQEAVAKRASCDGWRAKSQRFLFAAERREAAITAELDEVGRTNPWRNRVYADFWRGEIDWARSAGLLR